MSNEFKKLDKQIKNTLYLIITLMVGILLFYLGYFWLILDYPLTKYPDTLGTFGDYFGGILNPFVALAAFILLSFSIRIQQKELSETKEALKTSSEALQKQTRLMWRTSQLTAINTQMQSILTDIELARNDIKHLNEQIPNKTTIYTLSGERIDNPTAEQKVIEINKIVEKLVARKTQLNDEINAIRLMDDEEVEIAQNGY